VWTTTEGNTTEWQLLLRIGSISPPGGRRFDITLLIWKDPWRGHWWLQLGSGNALVGYWPSSLFTHLSTRTGMVQFHGEVVNTRPAGAPHTATQMGSGRFPGEGYARLAPRYAAAPPQQRGRRPGGGLH
jgi:hypothetical protein